MLLTGEAIAELKQFVTPANEVPKGEAGVHKSLINMDSRFRGNDTQVVLQLAQEYFILFAGQQRSRMKG